MAAVVRVTDGLKNWMGNVLCDGTEFIAADEKLPHVGSLTRHDKPIVVDSTPGANPVVSFTDEDAADEEVTVVTLEMPNSRTRRFVYITGDVWDHLYNAINALADGRAAAGGGLGGVAAAAVSLAAVRLGLGGDGDGGGGDGGMMSEFDIQESGLADFVWPIIVHILCKVAAEQQDDSVCEGWTEAVHRFMRS